MHDHFDLPGWGVYMHKLVDVLESKVLGLQRNSSQVYFYFLLSICLGRHRLGTNDWCCLSSCPAEILHLARVHRFSFPTSLAPCGWLNGFQGSVKKPSFGQGALVHPKIVQASTGNWNFSCKVLLSMGQRKETDSSRVQRKLQQVYTKVRENLAQLQLGFCSIAHNRHDTGRFYRRPPVVLWCSEPRKQHFTQHLCMSSQDSSLQSV